jgi:hypothetical protein
MDPDLSEILGSWPTLPKALRQSIAALVRASAGLRQKPDA